MFLLMRGMQDMYSMQLIENKYGNKAESLENNDAKLMLKYANSIINRHELFEIEFLGISDALSFSGYYICSLLLLFLLLWGISCSTIFTSKNQDYSKWLNISGINYKKQLLCEYAEYLIVTLVTLLLFAGVFGAAIRFIPNVIPEIDGKSITDCILFIIKLLPVIVMITLIQYTIYEVVTNNISAILLQFILTVVMGYFSGCFYPTYFFPDILQIVSGVLPVGAAFTYIRQAMSGTMSFSAVALIIGYAVLFSGITVFIKRRKITGDAI